jgi:two-component system NtrC family sensor kinase
MGQEAVADAVTQARLATLGSLIAGLTHELNTPLGALNSNHDVLRRALARLQNILADEVVEPHELDEVRRIVRAVDQVLAINDMALDRMIELVRNLHSFGRIDRAAFDSVDVHEGLDSTVALLAHELKNIEIVRDYGDIPRLYCHAQRLHQVFMNLLLNAVQALPDGGRITVRTSANDASVRVRIEDNGCGIAAEQQERVFEPGFTTRQGRVSMGLGLAICRQIVEQHGGTIELESAPGAGSAFTVCLPLRTQS